MPIERQLPAKLLPPGGGALLRRSALAEFMRNVARYGQFRMGADDIIGATAHSGGIFIRRQFHHAPVLVQLILELQLRWAEAFFCAGVGTDTALYSSSSQTVTYQHGSITTTITQPDPGPHLIRPPSESYTCESTTSSDNRIGGHDYGAELSTGDVVYSGELDSSSLKGVATAAVAHSGDVVAADEWDFFENAAVPDLTGVVVPLGHWEGGGLASATVYSYQYRWRLAAGIPLKIDWIEGGAAKTATLDPGASTDWYTDTIPATAFVNAQITNMVISKVSGSH